MLEMIVKIGVVAVEHTAEAQSRDAAADEEQTFKDNVAQYPQFQTAIDQLHDSKPQYAGALLSVFPEARQIVETEIENMINGNETPEKAVESMASQINSSIEDYNLVNE